MFWLMASTSLIMQSLKRITFEAISEHCRQMLAQACDWTTQLVINLFVQLVLIPFPLTLHFESLCFSCGLNTVVSQAESWAHRSIIYV